MYLYLLQNLLINAAGPYLVYSSSHLMKWKYCDRLTIDFLFKFTDEGYCFSPNFDLAKGRGEKVKEREIITSNN
jgi:hypothetical protein